MVDTYPTFKRTSTGGIAVYLIMGLSVLFLTTTIFASRLTVSEQRQSGEVDTSSQAYYAAEAGVEEAARRLSEYPDASIRDLFPEQFTVSSQPGDRSMVVDSNGNIVHPNVRTESNAPANGVASWRWRKVTPSYVLPIGEQVKDEVLQLDMSDLSVDRGGTVYCDTLPQQDCDSHVSALGYSSVREMLDYTEYCWEPRTGNPDMEFTVLSWPESNPQNVTTNKLLAPSTTRTVTFGGGTMTRVGADASGYNCVEINITGNRPHIIRIKPIFEGNPPNRGGSTASEHNQFTVSYKTEFVPTTNPGDEIFMPDNAVLIDVTGVAGNTKRRVVVKKERSGKILGIFDFAIYSGDTAAPLCKGGVVQGDYDYTGCVVN